MPERAAERLALGRRGGNPFPAQVDIPDGEHMLRQQRPTGVTAIADWLARTVE